MLASTREILGPSRSGQAECEVDHPPRVAVPVALFLRPEHEKAFLEFKAEIDEVLSPSEVAAVREKLGLSQRKAGELLGGGPRAFQKYESGAQAVSAPMSNLLRLLAKDPSRLREVARQVSRGAERRRAA